MSMQYEKHFFQKKKKNENVIEKCLLSLIFSLKKVQVGKDQEKAQSEKDSHSKNRDGKKTN